MKRSISFIVCLTIIFSVFYCVPFSASALKLYESGDYTYTVKNNKATIVGFNSNAKKVNIPSKLGGYPVVAIGYSAFYDRYKLQNLTIPKSVTKINGAFYWCRSLKKFIVDKNNKNYCSANGVLFNKNKTTLIQYPAANTRTKYTIPNSVTKIDNYAFVNCKSLTSITIGDSVTSIGYSAFSGCQKVKEVTIPDSVEKIDYDAFSGCTSLANINLPKNITMIGSSAFSETKYYKNKSNWENKVLYIGNYLIEAKSKISGSYAIKEGTQLIAEHAFECCEKLTSITIPDSVISICDSAFQCCQELKNVSIPDSVTKIGKYAFSDCTSLTNVLISGSVKNIDVGTFSGCTSLTSITIPDSVTKIDDYAFYGCTSLKNIKLGNSVKSISAYAFEETEYYKNKSNWENKVLYIDNYLIEAKQKISGSYTIKEGTKLIADDAFYKCKSLTSITIPDSVTNIGNYAFESCTSLKIVTIPDSVTKIGKRAFGYYYNKNYNEVKVSGFKIKGKKNSAAHKYAKKNGFKFVKI